jgi:C4-type Zn-finger protein
LPARVGKLSGDTRGKKEHRGKIRICPVCKKPTLGPADNISGWMTAEVFACSNCGYRGPICIEVDPDEFERSQKQASTVEKEEE